MHIVCLIIVILGVRQKVIDLEIVFPLLPLQWKEIVYVLVQLEIIHVIKQ